MSAAIDFNSAKLALVKTGERSRAVLHTDERRADYESDAKQSTIRKMRRGWLKDAGAIAQILERARARPGTQDLERARARWAILDRAQELWCLEIALYLDDLRDAVAKQIEREFPGEDAGTVALTLRENRGYVTWAR
jgi:hypothetical protein